MGLSVTNRTCPLPVHKDGNDEEGGLSLQAGNKGNQEDRGSGGERFMLHQSPCTLTSGHGPSGSDRGDWLAYVQGLSNVLSRQRGQREKYRKSGNKKGRK